MTLSVPRKSLIGIVIVIIAVAAFLVFRSSRTGTAYDLEVAKKSDFVLDVSVTGRVKPSSDVSLGFEKGGRATNVHVHVGDRVIAGQSLVSIDSSELVAALGQATAASQEEMARLDKLTRGARLEEIGVAEAKVQSARVAREAAKTDVANKLRDAYAKADDAVRNNVDQLFDNAKSSEPKFKYAVDYSIKVDVEWRRFVIEGMFASWGALIDSISTDSALFDFTTASQRDLEQVRDFLDTVALATNGLTANASLSQAAIDGYKSDVSMARTNINAAIVNLSSAEEKLLSTESNLSLSLNELTLTQAPATAEDRAAQDARVRSAQANMENIKAQIAKTILRSPMDGIVTAQDAKQGEIIPVGTPVVSIISDKRFKIEAHIPEVDVINVSTGDHADVALDAYNGVVFGATIVSVDPAEVIIQGVPTYKAILEFDDNDGRIWSGMTANIDIIVDRREGVISVPARAIFSHSDGKAVRIMRDNGIVDTVPVKTGKLDSHGRVEIITGVEEGDHVIITPTSR
ncbi:hypothetical protein AUJ44_03830 [Candidatus Nomurabacteria bacterium CG1_02_47_685]|nr:MAG: hypothetical protein AUJ44_03830 [Candidatus Nomurabacteria bacterium CG1_02_47_685]